MDREEGRCSSKNPSVRVGWLGQNHRMIGEAVGAWWLDYLTWWLDYLTWWLDYLTWWLDYLTWWLKYLTWQCWTKQTTL